MADTTLDQALPAVQDLADRKANAFVRRCGFAADEREDVRSQLLLSFLIRWPKFDGARASVRTFASRVMDKELTSILRYRRAASRRERDLPISVTGPSSAARGAFRIDFARAIATLPAPVQETAIALFWCSTLEAANELRCSRQMIHTRKRQIRAVLVSAGVGPRYFAAGGSR